MAAAGDCGEKRTKPNILITGTPGTGKSITATEVAQKTGLKYTDIGEVAKIGQLYDGWDEQFQCYILDEDKVISRERSTWILTTLSVPYGHIL